MLKDLKKKTGKEVNAYLNMKFGSIAQAQTHFSSGLDGLLKEIAKTGEIPSGIEWENLKHFLVLKLVQVCVEINAKYPDFHDEQNLSFEELLKEFIELLVGFSQK